MRRALAITLFTGLALTGCAAPEETTTAAAPKTEIAAGAKDEAAAQLLPADIRQAGKVRVASGVSFPPMEFFDTDNKTVLGFDADLGKALGEVLGVEFAFENVSFDGIIGGLNAGRYDLGLTSMLDKKERQEQVDFVDYLKSGSALMVAKGNPQGVKETLDMCGRKVAVEKAATGDLLVDDVTKKCAEAGKPAVEKVPFPDQASAVQALQSGRADMVAALDLTLAYSVKQAPQQFEVAVSAIDPLPVGIPVPKSKPQLRDAVQAALKKLIANGTYDQLLAKWNLQAQAFKDAAINAGA
ncbi:ABC transporter substrate-binding protein [Nonomuraea angiospora]|uniref:ABC transporter substrate-binding protein n=1 Tax=Nonomuraea angiospora TaxID=46172 RepID=UPI0033334123